MVGVVVVVVVVVAVVVAALLCVFTDLTRTTRTNCAGVLQQPVPSTNDDKQPTKQTNKQ